ncbi:hypothetical protein CHH28_07825 [Bacterioplanes sanyensis]|uniref:Catalase n=1 Tax=Bacterioplanes sanyensis TaxID=1249553 RepID=A0A222FHX3_9GAMM|nr:putative metalloprotease CJM1_0395 family protein [Bacterioplanes sanyensis]ASP38588.1 hypothetical protein CHH28_07825 [Bacterioplanes sanyensis]
MQVSAVPVALTATGATSPVVSPRSPVPSKPETQGNAAFAPVSAPQSTPQVSGEDTYSPPTRSAAPAREGESSTDVSVDDVSSNRVTPNNEDGQGTTPEQRVEEAVQEQELQQIQQLKQTDAEVRAHEQAHAAVGGSLAGAPTFTYKSGPDGVRYAVAGEVSIDVSKVSGDPQATLEKMERVRRAALAPAEPSAQDRQVAAQAARLATEARAEIASEQRESTRLQSGAVEQERQEARAELQEAREKQRAAEEKDKEDEVSISAAERFAEYNAKVRRINETLLRISQPSPISAGQLLNDIA